MSIRHRLARFLAGETGAGDVEVEELSRLREGAVQENWLLVARFAGGRLAGRQRLVLRTDAPTRLAASHDRITEFAIQRAAHAAGVSVPEPLFLCDDPAIIGRRFFLMRWLPGSADGARIVAGELGGDRVALAQRLAQELAMIHGLRPPRADLARLGAPDDAARHCIAELARALARDEEPHPVAEWGLRWLIRHAPPPVPPVLCHRDFRTGNYLAEPQGFIAMLDWEFARWSDPDEDIGWFCLGCWRFGAYGQEAGGIAPRTVFNQAYEAASGRTLDPLRIRYWEVMAALRWLVLALQQRDRFMRGGERSLDLALTGRRATECEFEILRLTEAA